MKKTYLILIAIFCSTIINGQTKDILSIRAILCVLDDFTSFNFIEKADDFKIDNIEKRATLSVLKNTYIYDCTFFKVRPQNSNCVYYLAYSNVFKRFFKLSGFRSSDFIQFYNRVLIGGSVAFPNDVNTDKKRLSYIVQNVKVEDINWNTLYNTYYTSLKNSLWDINSCSNKLSIESY